MPLYEYYCDDCDNVFEALRSIAASAEPAPCPTCKRQADRIMPTYVATRSRSGGWSQRVPYHHAPVRADAGTPERTIARVTPKKAAARTKVATKKAPKRE